MGAKIRELIDRVIEKVRELVAPPPVLIPVYAPSRPRRPMRSPGPSFPAPS